MNYSYVMGIDNINKLKEENFGIQQFGNSFGVVFSDEKIKLFEEYICKSLKNGFWNEYLGKDKVFIFKFKNGEIKRYVLNEDNEQEILKLCCEFASYEFESIDKMLRENEFYAENYYNKYCMDSNKPIWGMNYYGVTLDKTLGEEAMDNALRPALIKVGEDKNVIPVRGTGKYENNGYAYIFKTTGTVKNFDGIKQIYKNDILIYELHCYGGIIE